MGSREYRPDDEEDRDDKLRSESEDDKLKIEAENEYEHDVDEGLGRALKRGRDKAEDENRLQMERYKRSRENLLPPQQGDPEVVGVYSGGSGSAPPNVSSSSSEASKSSQSSVSSSSSEDATVQPPPGTLATMAFGSQGGEEGGEGSFKYSTGIMRGPSCLLIGSTRATEMNR